MHSFLLTGSVSGKKVKEFKLKIEKLNGKVIECNKDQFVSHATHIVCFEFRPCVKILSGLAAGKWLVSPDYITDSYDNGKWALEQVYAVPDYNKIALYHQKCTYKLYNKLNFAVEMNDPYLAKCIKRILFAGGATVISNADELKNEKLLAVISNEVDKVKDIQRKFGCDTRVVNIKYIEHTILKKHSPKDVNPFLMVPQNGKLMLQSSQSPIIKRSESLRNIALGSPSKTRVRCRTRVNQIPFSAEKYHNIASFFVKKEKNSESTCSSQPLNFSASPKITQSLLLNTVGSLKYVSPNSKNGSPIFDTLKRSDNSILTERTGVRRTLNFLDDSMQRPSKFLKTINLEDTVDLTDETLNNSSSVQKENTLTPLQEKKLAKTVSFVSPIKSEDMRMDVTVSSDIFVNNSQIKIQTIKFSQILNSHIQKFNNSGFISSNYFRNIFYPETFTDPTELAVNQSVFSSAFDCEFSSNSSGNKTHVRHSRRLKFRTDSQSENENDEGASNEKDIGVIIQLLDALIIRVNPDTLLNSKMLGIMIKKFVLGQKKADCFDLFGVLNRILELHPPIAKKIKNYYLNIFLHASEWSGGSEFFKVWSFLKNIFYRISVEKNGAKIENLMELLTWVLDVLFFDLCGSKEVKTNCPKFMKNKNVKLKDTICYKTFYVGTEVPGVLNTDVKELIQYWRQSWIKCTLSNRNSREISKALTKLISIVMEVMWKWFNMCNVSLFAEWPMMKQWQSFANEIFFELKKISLSSIENRQVLRNFHNLNIVVPWKKLFLLTILSRVIQPKYLDVSFTVSRLTELIVFEVENCENLISNHSDKPVLSILSRGEEEHAINMELLTNLFITSLEAQGFPLIKRSSVKDLLSSTSQKTTSSVHCDSSFKDMQKSLSYSSSDSICEEVDKGPSSQKSMQENINIEVAKSWKKILRKKII